MEPSQLCLDAPPKERAQSGKAETNRKYRPVTDFTEIAELDGRTLVTARVLGNLPGSPIELHYVFTLDGTKIASLEIR